MGKAAVLSLLLILLLFMPSSVRGDELDLAAVEDKINSITHYAEEYEIGNINYFQLNVYGFQIRSDLNLLLGGGIGENWARIPRENIEKIVGKPADYTTWVWVDNKHMEKRLNESMPRWERIIFDGRKVRIIFNAFPSAIELENGDMSKYYSVDLNVRFKKKFDFNFNSMLSDVKSLIADYNMTRTRKSGEILAGKMLEYERLLSSYVQENVEQCTETMGSLFTPDEKWPKEKTMRWRFSLYQGTDFDVMADFDMCQECEWHHVGMNFWVEGRGPMFIFKSPELQWGKLEHKIDEEYFQTLSADMLDRELEKAILEIRDEAEKFDRTKSEDFPKKFFFNKFKIEQINRILDGKYNEVGNFDRSIAGRIESGELQGPGQCKNSNECSSYCQKEENTDECREFTYNLRVDAIEKMFTGYKIEKTLSDRIWWERRLAENFETRQESWCRHVNDLQCAEDKGCSGGKCVPALGGNETCNNKVDDDGDNVVDCNDPDCWNERHCGKLCESVCNKEGGCWQTSHNMCSGVCKECWDCGGDENCKGVCEPACWPCHNQAEIKNVCDDCWTCDDEAYGGCYSECKPCDSCNTQRTEKINAIFNRAARGEIQTPGNCMSEEDCNRYCADKGGECREALNMIGLYSEEFDCNDECKECSICNNDLGNFKCNDKQHFDRDNGFCICDAGWYDCDGDWKNGCESKKPCNAGTCFEECKDCDNCTESEKCKNLCTDCHKCRNPEMPTYVCDGVEQLEPCETEYICNGVKQKKPCENYVCNGRKSIKPCDEINITCGKNQILAGNECTCREGFKDCDSDGDCESTRSCGLEICDDKKDNNGDGLVDCQDSKCNDQVCGFRDSAELLCIDKGCMLPGEKKTAEPETICGNHICEKGESEESCPEDCIACEMYEPPACSDGKIIWTGKDKFGCPMPPVCIATERACVSSDDCSQPKCGVSECIDGECKVTELLTVCEEGCEEGRTKTRACKDGSEITTAVCSLNEWVKTEYDCPEARPEVPAAAPEAVAPEENVSEEIVPEVLPEEVVPEENVSGVEENITRVPAEEITPAVPKVPPEEIAPEVEEEAQEARDNCVLAKNCGGSQDVCSNGNCVTLPIPVETPDEKETPPGQEKKQEKLEEKIPETPPGQEKKEEKSEPPPESESPATGGAVAGFANFVTGFATSLFEEKKSCINECTPCDECNQEVDALMRRMEAGEFSGPNNCNNRVECDNYCQMNEHRNECKDFFESHGLKTFYCWEGSCRECDKCRFSIGELNCSANQQFNMGNGFCECSEGWFECDGDWETGCESPKRCDACQVDKDCAADRCAPWGNVVQQFDCFKGESWTEERGVVRVLGDCRFYPTRRAEGYINFDGWGEPFENLRPIREETELEMGEAWCNWELENLINERIELQNSFTKNSLKWFFEEYVPSDPSEWEKHIGGIFDSYWRLVNNNERTAQMLLCTGNDKLPEEYEPIDVSYDTDFGSVRIWEVKTTTDFYGKRMKIISTYMQIWVFPSKEFVKKQFQEALKTGRFPDGPEGGPGPTPSEREAMKNDKKFMDFVNSVSSKYGGEAKIWLNVVDKDETVFNLLITMNPELPVNLEIAKTYESDYDAKITISFDFFYSLVKTSEEMRGGQTEYPPWERENLKMGDMIKGVFDGVKMWFMINSASMDGSIRAEPSSSLQDGLEVLRLMFERGQ